MTIKKKKQIARAKWLGLDVWQKIELHNYICDEISDDHARIMRADELIAHYSGLEIAIKAAYGKFDKHKEYLTLDEMSNFLSLDADEAAARAWLYVCDNLELFPKAFKEVA